MTTTTPSESDLLTDAEAARSPEEALKLLRECVAFQSITGKEAPVAHWSAGQIAEVVDSVAVDEFAPGRANVWARWGNAGANASRGLVLTSHLDVVNIHHWADTWAGDPRSDPWAAVEVDGAIWGRGVADCKAGLAAALAAVRQLDRAGLEPAAPLTIVFVADEESGEPDSGTSEGVRRAISNAQSGEHPIDGELVVYGEPTGLKVVPMHLGFFVVDLVLEGRSAYFGTPELGIDALKAAEALLPALRALGSELSSRPAHPVIGGPALLVTSVTAGGTISVPGECSISMIRSLIPGESLDEARQEIETLVKSVEIDPRVRVELQYPSRRDHEIGGTPYVLEPSAAAIGRTQSVVRHYRPDAGAIDAIPGWSEAPFFLRDLGLPTIYLGAGGAEDCHTPKEHVPTADYLSLVDSYVRLISEFCGLRRR